MNHSALQNWLDLTDALWDLTEEHPVVGYLCRTWAFQIAREANPQLTPSVSEQDSPPAFNVQSRNLTCDVVFVPCNGRSNYLGTCTSLLSSFTKNNPDLSAGILTAGLPEASLSELIQSSDWPLLSGPNFRGPLLRHLPQVQQLTEKIEERLTQVPHLKNFFRRHRADKFQRIGGDVERISAYKHWLTAINCKCVVIPNEQLEPAAHIVCAARELQIETVQILHGIPTRLYAPMLADQLWVWDEQQAATFHSWGVAKTKLHVAGFLEPVVASEQAAPKDYGQRSTWLFASQWQGSQLWSTDHFKTVARWVADTTFPAGEQLHVRFHPNDTEEDKSQIKRLFSHWAKPPLFSDGSHDLFSQLCQVKGVLTASSSVGYLGSLMGLPAATLGGEQLNNLHGGPLLPAGNNLESGEELDRFLKKDHDPTTRLTPTNFLKRQASVLQEAALLLGDEARKKSQEKWVISATHTGEQILPKNDKIHFGIVVPNLNQGQFLEAALQSIVAQDWGHFSFVVMDGGSTDNSEEIIRQFEKHATNVRIGPDGGQTHAIAAGFHQIPEATHLLWLNSDDRLLPKALTTFAQVIQKEPRHALYIGAGWQISGDGSRRLVMRDAMQWPEVRFWPQTYFLQPATVISRPAYEAVSGVNPDVQHAMDYDLWLRILHHHSAKCFSQPVCEVRMHADQKTARLRHEVLWETLALCFDDGARKDAFQLGAHLLRHEPDFANWAKQKGLNFLSRLSRSTK